MIGFATLGTMYARRLSIYALSIYALLILTGLVFSLPLLVMISGSLKSPSELAGNPYGLVPDSPVWENYPASLQSMPMALYLSNTLLLCAGCVVGTTLSCALAAYGLSQIRWRGRGRGVAFALVVATMLLPWHITMIPRLVLITKIGLYNSLWAIILPTFLGEAFYIFLLRQFFLTIPRSLFEAGRIDGLSHWGLFRHLAVPLSLPALATVRCSSLLQPGMTSGDRCSI